MARRCFPPDFKCQHFLIFKRRQMVADSNRSREHNIPISYVHKSSTVKQQTNENSRTLPGDIVYFRNLDTQAPQVGPSFLGVKKERSAIARPHKGLNKVPSDRCP